MLVNKDTMCAVLAWACPGIALKLWISGLIQVRRATAPWPALIGDYGPGSIYDCRNPNNSSVFQYRCEQLCYEW